MYTTHRMLRINSSVDLRSLFQSSRPFKLINCKIHPWIITDNNWFWQVQDGSVIRWFEVFWSHSRDREWNLPWHSRPFPWYPSLQVQLNDPLVLLHTASTLQLCVPVSHSSKSEENGVLFTSIFVYYILWRDGIKNTLRTLDTVFG